MARLFSLSSSSKGNCYYISGAGSSLLIDAGISLRQITTQLAKYDVNLDCIDGVLITHEHSDHIKGLNVMLKYHNIPVYASSETLDYLSVRGLVPSGAKLVSIDEDFQIGDVVIKAFDTPHDAVHSVGFRLEFPDENKIGFATDLGSVTVGVREKLEGCNLVVLESNFDHAMLESSGYPYMLQRRIKSELGHLANEDCGREIAHLIRTGTTRFVLGHLSEQNNVPALAYETTRSILEALDMVEGADYLLEVAPAKEAGKMVIV